MIRPYPQYTAGMPLILSFDPDTSVMHYEYTPRNTSAKTEIYVPTHIHYSGGYQVMTEDVTNIQYTEGGKRLIIDEDPTVTNVVIDITP
ncbi:MAG: hypothetical protein JW976_07260 [Syntrophaceae bacterium]|nr:hypothetical protein [Syntrophaceae bacterium]